MKFFTRIFLLLGFLAVSSSLLFAQSASLKVLKTFHIKSDNWWDYLAVSPVTNYVYVSHGNQVNILDKNTGDSVGVIPNTNGVHGIAFAPQFHKGFTSNGRLNSVTVFDIHTNQVLDSVATGENPDAIMYDDYSKTIITCNGRSKSLSVIDPATDKVIATIPLGGKPETAVSDGNGKVYVNIEDKSEISEVDMKLDKVTATWSIAPGESPSGLAMDRVTRRLFAGCDNKILVVINADNGAVVAQVPTGEGCDGVGFDPKLQYIYSSNGESGTLSVIKEKSANSFQLLQNVPTKMSARTCAVDEKSHHVFLSAAAFEKSSQPGKRPAIIPGSFQVLVVGEK